MALTPMRRTGLWTAAALLCLATAAPAWPQAVTDTTAGPLIVENPRRIDGGPDGTVLVTDRRYGTVVAVSRDSLEPVWSAQLPEGSRPFGLASQNRLVVVGDTGTQSVGVYRIVGSGGADTRLDFAYSLGTVGGSVAATRAAAAAQAGGGPGAIADPIGVGMDGTQNLIFVLDGATKTVSAFRRNGDFQYAFEARGEDGSLLSPVSLAVDTLRQEILVGDYGDPRPVPNCSFCTYTPAAPARILIFGYDGQLRFEIRGDRTTHWSTAFARVQGMAASTDGRIFAADPIGGRILVLDRISGALLGTIGTQGAAAGELMLPVDVWLDGDTGDLFVSNNRGARRVEALRGAGGQP